MGKGSSTESTTDTSTNITTNTTTTARDIGLTGQNVVDLAAVQESAAIQKEALRVEAATQAEKTKQQGLAGITDVFKGLTDKSGGLIDVSGAVGTNILTYTALAGDNILKTNKEASTALTSTVAASNNRLLENTNELIQSAQEANDPKLVFSRNLPLIAAIIAAGVAFRGATK